MNIFLQAVEPNWAGQAKHCRKHSGSFCNFYINHVASIHASDSLKDSLLSLFLFALRLCSIFSEFRKRSNFDLLHEHSHPLEFA